VNLRNGTRANTVMADSAGPVQVEVLRVVSAASSRWFVNRRASEA
jgi:hypothetical protein